MDSAPRYVATFPLSSSVAAETDSEPENGDHSSSSRKCDEHASSLTPELGRPRSVTKPSTYPPTFPRRTTNVCTDTDARDAPLNPS